MLFGRFFFRFLPELLGVADKMRTALQANQGTPPELFRQFVGEIWTLPEITQPLTTFLIVLVVALGSAYSVFRSIRPSSRNSNYFSSLFQAVLYVALAVFLVWLTWTQIQSAYAAALEEGTSLEIWSQVITISAGFVLLGLSWFLWNSANGRSSNLSTFMRLGAAIVLAIGAWVLIAELPRMIAAGDEEWWNGLLVTVYYSAGSIPFQFVISLTLATLLFQNIKGKGIFRVIYFLPYITPAVGAAAAFRILFSGRVDAPVNQVITALGFQPLGWLNEPNGIFQLMLGEAVKLPDWAAGPSLSMVVVIIFGVWTFIGFNTVVFLAGLGNIPGELYEAASIDGAGRWAQFRHITLPLLSPTLYFLTLYAVIGTFKAFNHIIVLRNGAALGTTDTASIVIFDTFQRDTRIGYAAALALLLLIIVMGLTVINNRIASRRVFYG
jgi:multiple sugar transport system permease protein